MRAAAKLFVLLLLVVVSYHVHGSFEGCDRQMSVLENALYETGDNVFALNSIFFPPSKRPSRFIRVTYTFVNETNKDDACNVTYIWAIGGFLFFQPPKLFSLTSLFFNHPNNDLSVLHLELPSECRGLVQRNKTSSSICSCTNNTERLNILTQQLDVYAKYTERGQLARENTFARAVCAEDLEDLYYSGRNPSFVFVIVSSTVVLPIFTLFLLFGAVRKMDDNRVNAFTQATSHGAIVALVMTGTIFTIMILVMNIMACRVVLEGNHEYSPFIKDYSINLYIVFGTLACNILFTLPLLFCLLYITVCFNARGILRRLCCNVVCSLHPCISRFISFAIGQYVFDKLETLSANNVVSLMFPLMMATPILCFSSHLGYILLAWLTEPSKCTAIFLLYYTLSLYFFFAFKKFYNIHSRMKLSSNLSSKKAKNGQRKAEGNREVNGIPLEVAASNGGTNMGERPQADRLSIEEEMVTMAVARHSYFRRFVGRSNAQYINTQMLCLLIFYSFVIIGIAIIYILMFFLLPISSENLFTYILQLLQLVVVLVSTQFAYKLFFGSSFSLESVVSKFKEVYAEKGGNERLSAIARQRHEELSDVAGQFAAELTDVVIQKQADRGDPVDHESCTSHC